MKYDAIIIDGLISYKNLAFDFGIVNLRLNNDIMALPNLIEHFYPEKNESFANRCLNLEDCGKLNGILLYDQLQKSGLECALVSNLLENADYLATLLAEGARSVIISTTWLVDINEVKKVTQIVRSLNPGIPIIAGGVLVYNSYLTYLQRDNDDFDYRSAKNSFFFSNQDPQLSEDIDTFIIDRSGIQTLIKVLGAIKAKETYLNLSNIAYYRGDELIINPQSPEEIVLDNQVISWDKIDSKYLPEILPMQLSLGCNFGCKFCNFFHKRHCYTKSKEYIRRELNWVRSRPEVRMIRFVDDSMPPKVLRDLCEIMIEEEINIPWTTFIRLDALAKENFTLLQEANCIDVQVGIESGDDRILKNMDKKATADKYLRILRDLAEFDMSIRASFIIGYPGENQESISSTIDFINQLPTDRNATFYIGLAPFVLLPLSPIFYESERKAYQLQGYFVDWQHESMSFNEVPDYLKKIFVSVKDDVLFAYTGDPMDINLPKAQTKKVKLSRQRYQKGIVAGASENELIGLESDLNVSLKEMEQLI